MVWALALALQGADEEFAPLFNGRDLDGWVVMGAESWEVADGVLRTRGGRGGWLRTTREYENFVLRLEYRVEREGGNSGIFLRATERGNPAFTGMEVQILADHGRDPDVHSSSSLYGSVAPARNMARPAGEWNRVEITLDGRRLRAVMNGERVLDVDLDDRSLPFQERPLHERARRGFIGLQDHQDRVEFRNLSIRVLP